MNLRTQLTEHAGSLPHLLDGFDPEYNVDRDVEAEVNKLIAQKSSFEVPKRLLAENILDVATLLDRMLQMRRELWDIDAQRVRTALGYINTVTQAEAENNVVIAQADEERRGDVSKACAEKLKKIRDAIAHMEERHGERGGSLNFVQRTSKLWNTLRQDIESCLVRSIAIEEGADDVYHIKLARPRPGEMTYATFDGAAHLDDWVSWHRKVSREIETIQVNEASYEFLLPLGTPYLFQLPDPGGIGDPIFREVRHEESNTLVPDLKEKIRTTGELSFHTDASEDIPFPKRPRIIPVPNARIQQLAVQVTVSSDNERLGWHFLVRLYPPGSTVPVTVDAITSLQMSNWISSRAIQNQPAAGYWRIEFVSATKDDVTDTRQADRNAWPITDVKIGMRVTGVGS